MKRASVIICAAGSSTRFGGDRKKPFVDISGRAAFIRSIEYFAERDDVCQVIAAISPEDEEIVKVKWGAALAFNGVKLCFGGAERFETVAKAMELVKDEAELIAVHDSVRCCLTKDWLDELFKTAGETGAAMLACPVVATLKKVAGGIIIDTLDRSNLYEAQTPQVFDAKLLKNAYAKLDSLDKSKITDDAQLVEAMGQD
jgi:2-C-methyl-D-erythritol 4-phosphate cytidylyltransferase